MPRGKSNVPPLLAATDRYRKAHDRLVSAKRELAKADAGYAEAETAYLALVAETIAARQPMPAPAGEVAHQQPA